MPSRRPFGLCRGSRIQESRRFASIRQQGRRVVRGCLVANWVKLPAGSASRVGVITSRKVGGAVQRSRARRLLRETFRLQQPRFREPIDLVLVARPSIQGKRRVEVERDFLAALQAGGVLPAKPAEQSGV